MSNPKPQPTPTREPATDEQKMFAEALNTLNDLASRAGIPFLGLAFYPDPECSGAPCSCFAHLVSHGPPEVVQMLIRKTAELSERVGELSGQKAASAASPFVGKEAKA